MDAGCSAGDHAKQALDLPSKYHGVAGFCASVDLLSLDCRPVGLPSLPRTSASLGVAGVAEDKVLDVKADDVVSLRGTLMTLTCLRTGAAAVESAPKEADVLTCTLTLGT